MLMQLDQLGEIRLPDRARHFSILQHSLNVLVLEDRLDLYRHLPTRFLPGRPQSQTRTLSGAASAVNPQLGRWVASWANAASRIRAFGVT